MRRCPFLFEALGFDLFSAVLVSPRQAWPISESEPIQEDDIDHGDEHEQCHQTGVTCLLTDTPERPND